MEESCWKKEDTENDIYNGENKKDGCQRSVKRTEKQITKI